MARRSARANLGTTSVRQKSKSRIIRAKSGTGQRARVKARLAPRGRVRVVRSRATGARRSQRPLPPADPLSERLFMSSMERSLRDYRMLWEALAKR
jgi:hypothetical protein